MVIAAAIVLALLTAAGIYIANKRDTSSTAEAQPPNVRIMNDNTQATHHLTAISL